MLVNQNTCLIGERSVLVPYCSHHVEKYNQWMQDTELQHLTGSEPLTLEDEFRMQEEWRIDDKKCTFILLKKDGWKGVTATLEEVEEVKSMVGDVNLFLSDDEESGKLIGEISIMIAEKLSRGQGIGWEATCQMLRYAMDTLRVEIFEAKIKLDNLGSVTMFQKLKFQEVSRSDAFQEITFRVDVNDPGWKEFIIKETNSMTESQYVKSEPISL